MSFLFESAFCLTPQFCLSSTPNPIRMKSTRFDSTQLNRPKRGEKRDSSPTFLGLIDSVTRLKWNEIEQEKGRKRGSRLERTRITHFQQTNNPTINKRYQLTTTTTTTTTTVYVLAPTQPTQPNRTISHNGQTSSHIESSQHRRISSSTAFIAITSLWRHRINNNTNMSIIFSSISSRSA